MQFKQLLLAAAGSLMASTVTSSPIAALQSRTVGSGEITHFVAFKFLANQTQADVDEVTRRFLALKNDCKKNNQTYILTVTGGTNNNPTGRNFDTTHGWINTFASKEDRDYYQFHDPIHLAFEEELSHRLASAFAFDFLPSTYQTMAELQELDLD